MHWVPRDLIPDRIPVLGHLDELSYILVSLAIARLLMPPRLVHHFARQLGNARDAHGGPMGKRRRDAFGQGSIGFAVAGPSLETAHSASKSLH